jgi:hypothetical protein
VPRPDHLGTQFCLRKPVWLYPSLFAMQMDGDPSDFDAGEYELVDVLRVPLEGHLDVNDGYSYCVCSPDGRPGWHCKAAFHDFSLPEEERSEDFEYYAYLASEGFRPKYKIGKRVQIESAFFAWQKLSDMTSPSARSREYGPGSYRIYDVGDVTTDDELDIEELENPFVIYAVSDTPGKTLWVPESVLRAAMK